MQRVVYFVGTEQEVAHHAAPLTPHFDIRIVGSDEVLQQATHRDLVVFFSEHFDRFRQAIVELKSKNVATLYLIDGILEWRNAWENRDTEPACPYTMRPVLSHKVACIGSSQARTLARWGNEEKTEVVGVARFDALRKRWLEIKDGEVDRPGDGPLRLLVMTAKTPGFTEEQIANTLQSLQDLKSFFDQTKKVGDRNLEVTWRLTQGLADQIGVKNQLDDLSGTELVAALEKSDAVISTQSTAMIEAMLMSKPVASLDYHVCPKYLHPAWQISSADQIESIITELANAPARKILFQNSQLVDTVELHWSATERLSQLIQSMFAEIDACLSDNKPIQFPASLLCSTKKASQLSTDAFDHAKIYPNVPEFQESDTTELQAQLSHSRREIEYLKRETTRLESELGQAHEIFEQIHNHPIAGPIVRLREKFMQFFQRTTKTNQAVEIKSENNPNVNSQQQVN